MKSKCDRRQFLAQSAAATAGIAAATHAIGAPAAANAPAAQQAASTGDLPTGKIGKLTVSRLISGGNLISGWSHSRDLDYVANLMRQYNTDEKVMDTLELLEQRGVNAIICDPREKPMNIFKKYWSERGGKMMWIAEGHPTAEDIKTNIGKSIDWGASAVYVQGVIGDKWWRKGQLELLGQCVEFIKSQGVPGGIGAHMIEVVAESEKAAFNPDFYVKTHHRNDYWSARRPDQNKDVVDNGDDNYWDMDPARTKEVMRGVKRPWIAFKTLAAGAIRPEPGFRFVFENGADFLCVGMFDFQVVENVLLVKKILGELGSRERPWMA